MKSEADKQHKQQQRQQEQGLGTETQTTVFESYSSLSLSPLNTVNTLDTVNADIMVGSCVLVYFSALELCELHNTSAIESTMDHIASVFPHAHITVLVSHMSSLIQQAAAHRVKLQNAKTDPSKAKVKEDKKTERLSEVRFGSVSQVQNIFLKLFVRYGRHMMRLLDSERDMATTLLYFHRTVWREYNKDEETAASLAVPHTSVAMKQRKIVDGVECVQSNTFVKMLIQITGLSEAKATELVRFVPTLRQLYDIVFHNGTIDGVKATSVKKDHRFEVGSSDNQKAVTVSTLTVSDPALAEQFNRALGIMQNIPINSKSLGGALARKLVLMVGNEDSSVQY